MVFFLYSYLKVVLPCAELEWFEFSLKTLQIQLCSSQQSENVLIRQLEFCSLFLEDTKK